MRVTGLARASLMVRERAHTHHPASMAVEDQTAAAEPAKLEAAFMHPAWRGKHFGKPDHDPPPLVPEPPPVRQVTVVKAHSLSKTMPILVIYHRFIVRRLRSKMGPHSPAPLDAATSFLHQGPPRARPSPEYRS